MVSNGELGLQGEWNAAVRLSLCCEQLSVSLAKGKKKKKENRAIGFSGTSGSWLATLLQLISADIQGEGNFIPKTKFL